MDYVSTEGIVLKKKLRGEQDGEVTIFTKDFGKIKASATGLFKTTSRLSSRLEPINYINANFIFKKDRFKIINVYLNHLFKVRHNNQKLKTALFLTSIFDKLLPDGFKDEELFNLFIKSLKSVEKHDPWTEKTTADFKFHFLGKFLKVLGHLGEPDLKNKKDLKMKIYKTVKRIILNLA